jgi:hypothetical protein
MSAKRMLINRTSGLYRFKSMVPYIRNCCIFHNIFEFSLPTFHPKKVHSYHASFKKLPYIDFLTSYTPRSRTSNADIFGTTHPISKMCTFPSSVSQHLSFATYFFSISHRNQNSKFLVRKFRSCKKKIL